VIGGKSAQSITVMMKTCYSSFFASGTCFLRAPFSLARCHQFLLRFRHQEEHFATGGYLDLCLCEASVKNQFAIASGEISDG